MSRLLGRYKTFPITLYRLQQNKKVILKEFLAQAELGKNSYDYRLQEDGLIHPNETEFVSHPNGISLRPFGLALKNMSLRYKFKYAYEIPKNTRIPENLILIHEMGDGYSLESTIKCTPEELNDRLTKFLKKQTQMSKENFLRKLLENV
jgi:hypothetical protein